MKSHRNLANVAVALAGVLVMTYACSSRPSPAAPTVATTGTTMTAHTAHVSSAGASDDKGYIDGWFDGEDVHLYYTKSFFCAEPPASGAPSNCEIGADAQVDPRPGPIPTIYAIVPAGLHPDPATLACQAGSVCLDHPAMIDASRILGPNATSVNALPHSHIVAERRAGWFHTVNIRVFNIDAWNAIAAAKSLATVRELQGDPATGRPGIISGDTPTNIFFFIASWRPDSFPQ
jgi:hypothetical protein